MLNTLINKILSLDPDLDLSALNDKLFLIEVTDWPVTFYLKFKNHQAEVLLKTHYEPDTTIHGKAFDLFKMGKAPLEISGDVHAGHALQTLFQQLDIDWEEGLSQLTGDSLAYAIAKPIKQAHTAGKTQLSQLQQNLKSYLIDETQLLPSQAEASDFYQQIHQLRLDLDRLEALINRNAI